MLTENIWYLKMTKELKNIAAQFAKDQFTTDKAKLEKYGCDWYKGITPNAAAIIFIVNAVLIAKPPYITFERNIPVIHNIINAPNPR